MIHTLTSIPSDCKSMLDDIGLNYDELEDYELFLLLAPTLSVAQTKIIFGDINFQTLKTYRKSENDKVVLADKSSGLVIDELIYFRIVNYLRRLHGLKKKVEHAANEATRKILIDEDRHNIELNKKKPYHSFLLPIVSSVKVRMGYTTAYVRKMGIYELMDDIGRLGLIVNSDALLGACYSGFVDSSKIKKSELNWMKDLSKD